MKLKTLHIINYRNFVDSGVIPYHGLTIFVGENGSGKTSILDALSLLIQYGLSKPVENDFIDVLQPIEVEGTFSIPECDEEFTINKYLVGQSLTLRYSYSFESGTAQYSIKCMKYVDDRFNTYSSLNAEPLKGLVRSVGLTPQSTKAQNHGLIKGFLLETQPEQAEGHTYVTWDEIGPYMPIFQRYSSADYTKPENIVRKTLETIYRSHFYEADEETGEEKLKTDFTILKNAITEDLNQNINNQLKVQLSRHLEDISSVGGEYNIDFTRGLTMSSVILSFSNGDKKSIDQLGEGHKKKATLAVLEWDAEVSRVKNRESIIKAYDEPDANLDFIAQRKIYNTISNDVGDNDHVSVIICTHSLVLIDRASAGSINRIALSDNKATIEYLNTNEDEDIKNFLSNVAEISGLRNSSIFYEKAFLVVEGESEEASIGLLYKKYTGRSLFEDGIVLINIKTNGQWNNVLKFLSSNKGNCTAILLDADTQQAGSTRQVTVQKLTDSGFDADFITDSCFFIGNKEFEDTYSDSDLAAMANQRFPKDDGANWIHSEFSILRSLDKFSSEISKLISREHRSQATKPMIAYNMALLYDKPKILQNIVLRDLFDKLIEITSA